MNMTDELWAALASIEKHSAEFDLRYNTNKTTLANYDTLVRYKYASFSETGPGGSVCIYTITPSGKEALAAHKNQ